MGLHLTCKYRQKAGMCTLHTSSDAIDNDQSLVARRACCGGEWKEHHKRHQQQQPHFSS